jgi:hypothetical protein
LLSAAGLLVTCAYLSTLIAALILTGTIQVHPLWLGITGVFIVQQVVTVRARGWKMMALASVLIVEIPYDLFLQATHARALCNAVFKSERGW